MNGVVEFAKVELAVIKVLLSKVLPVVIAAMPYQLSVYYYFVFEAHLPLEGVIDIGPANVHMVTVYWSVSKASR